MKSKYFAMKTLVYSLGQNADFSDFYFWVNTQLVSVVIQENTNRNRIKHRRRPRLPKTKGVNIEEFHSLEQQAPYEKMFLNLVKIKKAH